MLYLTQNTDSLIITNVQELANDNKYLLHLEHQQYEDEVVKMYPTIEQESKRFVSFVLNLPNKLGEYKYTFYDGNGVDLDGDFLVLQTGLLKIVE